LYKYLSNEKIETLRDKYNQVLAENRWLRENEARNSQTGILLSAINGGCCNNACYGGF
jgi:hypothetical protein